MNSFIPPVEISKTLADGESLPVNQIGVFFRLIESNGKLKLSFNQGQRLTGELGVGYQCLPGEQFDQVVISNDSGAPVTFIAQIGRMYILDSRLNVLTGQTYLPVVEPATVLAGTDTTSIAAGAHVDLSGTPGAGQYRRSGVMVDNLDAASALTIFDQASKVVGYVLPGSTRFIPVSGFVRISNETGVAISCGIGEIWELSS